MHLSIHAWNDVQETTISKAFQFQHTGFTTVIEKSQDNVPVNMSEEELLINGLGKINPLLPEILFQDFLNVDSVVICTDEIPDVEIIAHIMNEKKYCFQILNKKNMK